MNKRGSWAHIFTMFYVVIVIVIFLTLSWEINSAKDDTGYSLNFYCEDISFAVEGMLWADADDISFNYDLKEGYVFDVKGGVVKVSKNGPNEECSFREREGYGVKVSKISENEFLIKRVVK
jgi:hypothetical protein